MRTVVASQKQQTRRQVLSQWRFAGILTIAAFEECFAGSIDKDFHIALIDKGMNADIGVDFAHARTRIINIAEGIADGIFDFQTDKIQAFHIGALAFDFDFEGLLQLKPTCPMQISCQFVDILFIAITAFGQTQQNTAGNARMQVDAIHLLHRAFTCHTAVNSADILTCHVFEFLRQRRFQTARTSDKK